MRGASGPGAVHEALSRALARAMAEECRCPRSSRLSDLSGLVGRPVASTRDLSTDELRTWVAFYADALGHRDEMRGAA